MFEAEQENVSSSIGFCNDRKSDVGGIRELRDIQINIFSSISFIFGFCTPFGVSRVVCSAHIHLLAP